MRVEDYEYTIEEEQPEDDIILTDERMEELIKKIKDQIVKEHIALHKIFEICENSNEYRFIYDWLEKNKIKIRGINGTLSGELKNYEYVKRLEFPKFPEALEKEEQEQLLIELNNMKENGVDTNSKKYQDIRQKLIIHNIRLALWTVGVSYRKKLDKLGIEEDDLKQMAIEELINLIDTYDISKGYEFSTYAVPRIYWGIRKKWRTEINNDEGLEKDWKRLESIEAEMIKNENRLPTDEEIKEILEINDVRLENLKRYIAYHLNESLDSLNIGDEELIKNLQDDERVEGLDRKPILNGIYIDEDGLAGEEDPRKVDIAAEISLLKADLNKVFETLRDREKRVLELRFGLKDRRTRTLEEVRT